MLLYFRGAIMANLESRNVKNKGWPHAVEEPMKFIQHFSRDIELL